MLMMILAYHYARNAECHRRKVGAVIVGRDGDVLYLGKNGCGLGTCQRPVGCKPGEKLEYCAGYHAEERALQAAKDSMGDVRGCTMYVTVKPCLHCAQLIAKAGLKRVVYHIDYPSEGTAELRWEAGVELEQGGMDFGEKMGM